MTETRYFFVFDVESVGIQGDAFAFGLVVVDAVDGREIESRLAWCDPKDVAHGSPIDREWVRNHVPAFSEADRVSDARQMRDVFWALWDRWVGEGAKAVADCPWPVEARFLHACVADKPGARDFAGPYPLIDVASVRFAAGLDPLGNDERLPDELPMHNPLADARQSARLLFEALRISAGAQQQ